MRLVLAASVLLALLSVACGGASEQDAASERIASSAVGIVTAGCGLANDRASGVVADRPGTVITVAHAVAGATDVTVVDPAGTSHPASVIWFDPDSDIAVLDAPSLTAPALEVKAATSGDDGVLAVWSADETVELKPATIVRRIDVTIEDIYVQDKVQRAGLEVSADVERGDSGAGLIVDGQLAGVVYANSRARDSVAFALDHTEIFDALAGAGEAVATGPCL